MQAHTHHVDLNIRRRARQVLLLTLASLGLAGGAALAQSAQPAPQAQPMAAADKAAAEAAFTRADADKDGKLSRAEAAKLPAVATRFDELDADKDGQLSLAEYMAGMGTAK